MVTNECWCSSKQTGKGEIRLRHLRGIGVDTRYGLVPRASYRDPTKAISTIALYLPAINTERCSLGCR